MQKIPVYIITGFLGAGKTTLLNKILRDNPATQFAIIENEFGEVNIDSGLVIGASGDIYELQNGCVCCTRSSELADTLIALADSGRKFDCAVIETTGVADPNGVAGVLYSKHVSEIYIYGGTICVIDENEIKPENMEIAGRQISFAEALVFRGNPAESKNYKLAGMLNPGSLEVNFAEFDFNAIANSGFKPKEVEEPISSKGFGTFALRYEIPFEYDYFNYAAEYVLSRFENIYRAKGFVNFAGKDETFVFHSVGKFIQISPADVIRTESVLVFIGRDIDKDFVEKQFREALAEAC
jgi:G3E family GTPase